MRSVLVITLFALTACDVSVDLNEVGEELEAAANKEMSEAASEGEDALAAADALIAAAKEGTVPKDVLERACSSYPGVEVLAHISYAKAKESLCDLCKPLDAETEYCAHPWPRSGMATCDEHQTLADGLAKAVGGEAKLAGVAKENHTLLTGWAKTYEDCMLDATPEVLGRLCKEYPAETLAAYVPIELLKTGAACNLCKKVDGYDEMFCTLDWPRNDVGSCSDWTRHAKAIQDELGVADPSDLPQPARSSHATLTKWAAEKVSCAD